MTDTTEREGRARPVGRIRQRRTRRKQAQQLWQQATTLPELGELMARWLEGDIIRRPGYCGQRPDPETTHLVPVLARLNRAGYVTEGSQPGLADWGYDGQWWRQRAGVSGFCDEDMLARVRAAADDTGLTVIAHRAPDRRRWCSRPWRFPAAGMQVTVAGRDPRTVFGARLWLDDLESIFDEVGRDGFAAVRRAWQVTVVDPEWGRDDRLWSVLDRVVRR